MGGKMVYRMGRNVRRLWLITVQYNMNGGRGKGEGEEILMFSDLISVRSD